MVAMGEENGILHIQNRLFCLILSKKSVRCRSMFLFTDDCLTYPIPTTREDGG
ncbi:hypothetical protein CLV36_11529 [Laceyella sediminis]|jgi:hypothetical protein|uniref:Uncharacterized protein n=1 Tax=Laceyella sediminis TaxID=573074 RepID=A0ABX5EKB1_9BACL|nr:hypothetical protein [Laceyella sediminis]PRZ12264.1 hypothetical protein CLV36_11529 [Laceyella sediminis]